MRAAVPELLPSRDTIRHFQAAQVGQRAAQASGRIAPPLTSRSRGGEAGRPGALHFRERGPDLP